MSDLRKIPGVGENMERRLVNIGYPTLESLKGQNPEALYAKDCEYSESPVDRCVLYAYWRAVYFAENDVHEPEKLKWWNWKD